LIIHGHWQPDTNKLCVSDDGKVLIKINDLIQFTGSIRYLVLVVCGTILNVKDSLQSCAQYYNKNIVVFTNKNLRSDVVNPVIQKCVTTFCQNKISLYFAFKFEWQYSARRHSGVFIFDNENRILNVTKTHKHYTSCPNMICNDRKMMNLGKLRNFRFMKKYRCRTCYLKLVIPTL
jgi:hypothetical protein